MRYKVLVLEDEVLISEHLREILLNLNYEVTDVCSSFLEAIESINTRRPDLALLDIRMDGKDQGIEVAKSLRKLEVPFIFVTSFSDKKTLQAAVKEQPKEYILKPFSEMEIKESLENVFNSFDENTVQIKQKNGSEIVPFNDIKWIKSDNVYIEVHTREKKFVVREKLDSFCEQLPEHLFFRIHRSYVVNKSFIDRIEKASIFIEDERIPVSKSHKQKLKELF